MLEQGQYRVCMTMNPTMQYFELISSVTVLSNARIQGMTKDLKLVGYEFNWALTVFYIPYLM